jgi:hypothetical protein
VDADLAVHELRDGDIPGNARQLIRRLPFELSRLDQEIDHLLDRRPRRLRQIEIRRHADVVGHRIPHGSSAHVHDSPDAAAVL